MAWVTSVELDGKVRDVVGLYLNPPDNAVVVYVDEKSQVQALDPTAPPLSGMTTPFSPSTSMNITVG